MSIHDRARGRWVEIWTIEFGLPPKLFDGKHHPCPGCGGEDRFRLNSKKRDHGVVFCGSKAMGGVDFIMHATGLEFPEVAKRIEKVVGRGERKDRELTVSENIMAEAEPLRMSRYLESRGIFSVPEGLYGVRALDYWDGDRVTGTYPAIIAPMWRDKKLVTVQATFLQDGRKAPVRVPKKTMPGPYETINGAAVRLGEWVPGQALGFAEGVETAISAALLNGHPVWATLSTAGMKSVDWPKGLSSAIIYADNDKSLAGHAAAWHLAHRLALAGIEVDVRFPPVPGTDWNDVLMERNHG